MVPTVVINSLDQETHQVTGINICQSSENRWPLGLSRRNPKSLRGQILKKMRPLMSPYGMGP